MSTLTFPVPVSLLTEELSGVYRSSVLKDLSSIIGYYDIYDKGVKFITEGSKGDYVPSDLRFKQVSSLINKEARFLFSRTPDIMVNTTTENRDTRISENTQLQTLVNTVLMKSKFSSKLLKAAKDCFIGKRVAYFVNFDEAKGTIKVNFIPSLEFVYETDTEDSDVISKIVVFYTTVESKTPTSKRIYKKKYWMQDGLCWIGEYIYDGMGSVVETTTPERATRFPYIPAGVIVNDGLTGDLLGESEVETLKEFEGWYSRLANADMDAERQGMNPIRWISDMNPASTKGLSMAPGSIWDLSSDQNAADGTKGSLGVLETSMSYSTALGATLGRIKAAMFESIDMPDVSSDALKGVVTSGKTLEAIYWGLTVRCDEKMLAWSPAIEHIVRSIIDGALLYPGSTTLEVPKVDYRVKVINRYPLPEDETESKGVDLAEVMGQTRSKRSYIEKWDRLTEEESDLELSQIAAEMVLLQDTSYGGF